MIEIGSWLCCSDAMESEIPLPDGFQPTEGRFPTYKALLELKKSADGLDFWQKNPGVPCSGPQELLAKWITKIYPAITIHATWPLFYQMVERLQLPTTGPKALIGEELTRYLSRTWVQHVTTNCQGQGTHVYNYGLPYIK